jgi:hypothetical protein
LEFEVAEKKVRRWPSEGKNMWIRSTIYPKELSVDLDDNDDIGQSNHRAGKPSRTASGGKVLEDALK